MKKKPKMSDMSHINTADGNPDTAFDMVDFYGTYEIQPTQDTDNTYPAIAQGFNQKQVKTDRQNPQPDKKTGKF